MLGAIHKVRMQNFANFWPPPPSHYVYATRTQWPWPPPPPLYARTQFDLMYTKYNKHNTELVNRSPKLSFYANVPIFNYNIKFIKCRYLWWIFKKMRTYAAAWPPLPRVRNACASTETLLPLSVRTCVIVFWICVIHYVLSFIDKLLTNAQRSNVYIINEF